MIEDPGEDHWESAAAFVTLDLVAPFLPELGLGGLDLAALRDVTREILVAEAPPDDTPPWSARWLGTVEGALGRAAAAHVDRWTRFGFAPLPSTHQDWVAWNTVFALVDRTEEGFRRLRLPPETIPVLLPAYERSRATDDLEALERSQRGNELSLWDVQLCAALALMPDEEDDRLWGCVRTTWDNHRFQIFFGEVVALLDPGQLARLFRRAQALRRADGLSVERLVDPTLLRPAVPWRRTAS